MFPMTIKSQLSINTLYVTGAARSSMNYKTIFSLGFDLDVKSVPHVCTASGTDVGAIRFVTLTVQS